MSLITDHWKARAALARPATSKAAQAVASAPAAARPSAIASLITTAPAISETLPVPTSPLSSVLAFSTWDDPLASPFIAAGRDAGNVYSIDEVERASSSPYKTALPPELGGGVDLRALFGVPLGEESPPATPPAQVGEPSSSADLVVIAALALLVLYIAGGR